MPNINLNNIKSIAVFRTDKLGDMVLTLPLCEKIKQYFPAARLSLIAKRYTKDLLINQKFLDNTIFIDDSDIKNIFKSNKFDLIFFPRPKLEEAWAAFSAGIKYRVGTAYRWYSPLFNIRLKEHRKYGNFSEAEYNIHLLEFIIGNKIQFSLVKPYISPEIFESLNNKIENYQNILKYGYFIIHPASGGSSYEWPAKSFGMLGRVLSQESNSICCISGINSEADKCNIAAKECRNSLNLCGKLTLPETIAFISNAKFFISNSTGVLHIAASLNIPTIGFYPNSPNLGSKRWGPYSNKALCISPQPEKSEQEFNDNMASISVETASDKSIKFLSKFY